MVKLCFTIIPFCILPLFHLFLFLFEGQMELTMNLNNHFPLCLSNYLSWIFHLSRKIIEI